MTKSFSVLMASLAVVFFSASAMAATPSIEEEGEKDAIATFEKPIQLKASDKFIKTDEPGYASPCWADMDGDGVKDLLVGQFSGGKIKVYRHLGNLKFAEGKWLEADGSVAEVPGVW